MFIRIAPNGIVNGSAQNESMLSVLDGHRIIDIGNANVPTKNVTRSVVTDRAPEGDIVYSIPDESGIQVDESNSPMFQIYEETVNLLSNPEDFTASEVADFVKQARIAAITEKYTGPEGAITKLRNSYVVMTSEGRVASAITSSINAKKLEMQNEIKEAQLNG